ncbi:MAG: hypothetical protein Q8P26_02090 [Candidatus Levybacteria bacterium]|nr:hypothetical protein [Candidatus Levybacteria bacterium]
MQRSRLSRRIERKTKKNLILSVLGIIILTFLMFKLGIPLLVNLSLFLSGSKGGSQEQSASNNSFIAPPILNSSMQATSSANISISGIAAKNQTINLYINDDLINKTKTKETGEFLFNEKITAGENVIKTKAIAGDKESDFSQPLIIVLKSAPPFLDIDSPTDGLSLNKDQNFTDVKGTTDADVKITVNGFWAITDDNGNYSYRLPLQNGENRISVVATDIAGNKTEKEVKISYSP